MTMYDSLFLYVIMLIFVTPMKSIHVGYIDLEHSVRSTPTESFAVTKSIFNVVIRTIKGVTVSGKIIRDHNA